MNAFSDESLMGEPRPPQQNPQAHTEAPNRASKAICKSGVHDPVSETGRGAVGGYEGPKSRGLKTSQPQRVVNTPYLFIRSGRYYFKRKIPADAQGAFPNQAAKQVWRSLDTDMLHIAVVRLKAEISLFEETIARYRRRMALEQLNSMNVSISPQGLTRHHNQSPTDSQLSSPDMQYVLRSGNLDVGKANDSDVNRNIVRKDTLNVPGLLEQLRSLVQAVEQLAVIGPVHGKLAATSAAPPPLPPLSASLNSQSKGPIQEIQKPNLEPNAPTLYLLFEDWKLTQTRHRTVAAVENALQEFVRCSDTVVVDALTRHQARKYRDTLVAKGLSKSTIENRLGFLATLFRHGQRELTEHLHINPFERIEIRAQPIRTPKNRRAFESTELNQILQSKLYSKGFEIKGQPAEVAYWLPLLGMFTGARLEEICQLYLSDIQCINGVYAIRFANLEEGQKLKTLSSYRRVPIHKELIMAGFLKHVEQMRALGHERVFPSLSNKNCNGSFSNAAGKWFARFLDTIKLTDTRLDFHSFRYTFKQQCTLNGIPNEVRDALSGHWSSASDASRVYMRAEDRQYPFPALVQAIESLEYPEVNFKHLHIE